MADVLHKSRIRKHYIPAYLSERPKKIRRKKEVPLKKRKTNQERSDKNSVPSWLVLPEIAAGLVTGAGSIYSRRSFDPPLSDRGNGHSICVYPGGATYSGDFCDHKRSGRGELKRDDGSVEYDGSWEDDLPHGNGTYFWSSQARYSGTFHKGRRSGSGVKYRPSGDVEYDGDWQNDLPHGNGQLTDSDESTYVGDFRNGVRHGRGSITRKDGVVYDGQWKHDSREGKGMRRYPDGSYYDGTWSRDKPHGRGKDMFADGRCYVGEMSRGRYHGTGELRRADGSTEYSGQWHRGDRHGTGYVDRDDGTVLRGRWNSGKLHGEARIMRGDIVDKVQGWRHGKLITVVKQSELTQKSGESSSSNLDTFPGEFVGNLIEIDSAGGAIQSTSGDCDDLGSQFEDPTTQCSTLDAERKAQQ
eukprot:193006_1